MCPVISLVTGEMMIHGENEVIPPEISMERFM